jgi:hypothetical protein
MYVLEGGGDAMRVPNGLARFEDAVPAPPALSDSVDDIG